MWQIWYWGIWCTVLLGFIINMVQKIISYTLAIMWREWIPCFIHKSQSGKYQKGNVLYINASHLISWWNDIYKPDKCQSKTSQHACQHTQLCRKKANGFNIGNPSQLIRTVSYKFKTSDVSALGKHIISKFIIKYIQLFLNGHCSIVSVSE